MELRDPHGDPGALAGRRLNGEPGLVPEDGAQALVDVVQADALLVARPGQGATDLAGVGADAVVLDGDRGVVVGVLNGDLEVPRSARSAPGRGGPRSPPAVGARRAGA